MPAEPWVEGNQVIALPQGVLPGTPEQPKPTLADRIAEAIEAHDELIRNVPNPNLGVLIRLKDKASLKALTLIPALALLPEALAALKRCEQGYLNLIEFRLIPPSHFAGARQYASEIRAVLAKAAEMEGM